MLNPPPGLIRRSEGFMPFDTTTTRRDSIPHDTLQNASATGNATTNPTAAPPSSSSISASAAQQEWVSAPRWSQGLWSGQGNGPFSLSDGPKKTFRSLSFSQPQDTQRAGSHMLDTFNEEEGTDDELIDRFNATTLTKRYTNSSTASASSSISSTSQQSIGMPASQQQQQQQVPPSIATAQTSLSSNMGQQQQQQLRQQQAAMGQNLWFGAGRRHSYAGEHIQIPKLNTSVNANNTNSVAAVSPTAAPPPAAMTAVVAGSTAGNAPSQTVATDPTTVSNDISSEIDRYFSVDELGRNSMDYDYSSISQVEAAGLISVPSRKLYYVEFKSGRVDVFFIAHNSSLFVKVGDLVIVDADRGRDLGKIVKDGVTPEEAGMLKLKRHQEQQAILQHNPNAIATAGSTPGITMPKQILRFAQPSEAQQILSKQQDEEKAMAMCLQKVNEKGLAMTVLDAEYQWDRRKLTFFYSATHRIDFRDLVRDLFRIYKTRIWMCAVHTKVAKDTAHSPTAMMPATAPAGEYGLFNNRAMPPPPQMPPPHMMSSAMLPPPNGLPPPPPPHLAPGNMPPRFQSQFVPDVWGVGVPPPQQPYRPEQQQPQQQQYWYY